MGRLRKKRGRPELNAEIKKDVVKGFRASDNDLDNIKTITDHYGVDDATAIRLAINLVGLEVVNKNKRW